MTLSLVLILCVALLATGAWALAMTQESKKLLNQTLVESQSLNQNLLSENKRLATMLASKDPMTFQLLSQESGLSVSPLLASDPYESVATDEDEYRKWARLTNRPVADEDELDDLNELGLVL